MGLTSAAIWDRVNDVIRKIPGGEAMPVETFIRDEKLVTESAALNLPDVAEACKDERKKRGRALTGWIVGLCMFCAVCVAGLGAAAFLYLRGYVKLGSLKKYQPGIVLPSILLFVVVLVVQKMAIEIWTEDRLHGMLKDSADEASGDTVAHRLQTLYRVTDWKRTLSRYNDVVQRAIGPIQSQTTIDDVGAKLAMMNLECMSAHKWLQAFTALSAARLGLAFVVAAVVTLVGHQKDEQTVWAAAAVIVLFLLFTIVMLVASANMWREFDGFVNDKGFPASVNAQNFHRVTDRLSTLYAAFRATNTMSWSQWTALAFSLAGVSVGLATYTTTSCMKWPAKMPMHHALYVSLGLVGLVCALFGAAAIFSVV
jgi:hypothetical protein